MVGSAVALGPFPFYFFFLKSPDRTRVRLGVPYASHLFLVILRSKSGLSSSPRVGGYSNVRKRVWKRQNNPPPSRHLRHLKHWAAGACQWLSLCSPPHVPPWGGKHTSMGSGRGGRSEDTRLEAEWKLSQETSLVHQLCRHAADRDSQQRRAGQRFHYRRRARWRNSST